MSSTTSKNTPGNYQLEQLENEKIKAVIIVLILFDMVFPNNLNI
jgi:hypothetical protein